MTRLPLDVPASQRALPENLEISAPVVPGDPTDLLIQILLIVLMGSFTLSISHLSLSL